MCVRREAGGVFPGRVEGTEPAVAVGRIEVEGRVEPGDAEAPPSPGAVIRNRRRRTPPPAQACLVPPPSPAGSSATTVLRAGREGRPGPRGVRPAGAVRAPAADEKPLPDRPAWNRTDAAVRSRPPRHEAAGHPA
ncbi:hypothetical protein STXM2123_1987 [Streptomyces sp. F-3]|nr:hypothetical protein STXM2123_1987 [Streptomyces sp. F-3]